MQNNRGWLFKFFRDNNLKYYNSKIKTPAYLDLDKYFADYRILEDSWREIKQEIEEVINSGKTLPKFHEVDDGQEYISANDGISWNMFNIKTYGFWHKENIKLCPRTIELLKPYKNVSSIYFSILSPGKHIPPHIGPYKGIFRYQLAISVPKVGTCQLFVDNKPYSWTEGKSVIFDDTFVHEVKNETKETRIALLLDVRRDDFPFFLMIYDYVFFKIIQLLVIINKTMQKSTVN